MALYSTFDTSLEGTTVGTAVDTARFDNGIGSKYYVYNGNAEPIYVTVGNVEPPDPTTTDFIVEPWTYEDLGQVAKTTGGSNPDTDRDVFIKILGNNSYWEAAKGDPPSSGTGASEGDLRQSDGGYEFTGGFSAKETGADGGANFGTYLTYDAANVAADEWLRFGFTSTSQVTEDVAYWTDPDPSGQTGFDQTKGLFGGLFMPYGATNLIDYSFNESPGYSAGVNGQSLNYTAADGSFDFSQCQPGDFAQVRFDFEVRPQVANTTLQIAMIWQTRDDQGNQTAIFPLTGTPLFYGTGTVGAVFLNRPVITAYFASNEDVRAKALLAIKADNPIQIAPITTLVTIGR